MANENMKFDLKIWKQHDAETQGYFEEYHIEGVSENMSFLEMLDLLNEKLIKKGNEPVEFDYDCREGICGSCNLVINGYPHGHKHETPVCELYMREFKNIQNIVIEPWRAAAFPVIKDLVVDRSALDRIIAAGGYISTKTGEAPEANTIPVRKENADRAFDYATCIGCGACVAACPNSSASLFTGAKIAHLRNLPQGELERETRAVRMVEQMEKEGFGDCSNHAECEAVCPVGISISAIAEMRKDYMRAVVNS